MTLKTTKWKSGLGPSPRLEPFLRWERGYGLLKDNINIVSLTSRDCLGLSFQRMYIYLVICLHFSSNLVSPETHKGLKRGTLICLPCPMLVIIRFGKYHIWNEKKKQLTNQTS